jgi:hypothetical protein
MARQRKQQPTMDSMPNSAGSSSVSSTVSNVVNTGQRSVSTQTTGSTGNVSNSTNSIEIHGTPGTPGREVSASISLPSGTYTFPNYQQPGLTLHAPPNVNQAVNDALDHAQTHLTDARARVEAALQNVPADQRGQFESAVNTAFGAADTQIANTRKRYT